MSQIPVHKKIDWYLSSFEAFEKSLNGESASLVHSIRKAALGKFADMGFPTTHDEEWRFTDVAPIARTNFKPILRLQTDGLSESVVQLFALGIENQLVFVNGHYAKNLSCISSLPQGAKVTSLAEALATETATIANHLARYVRSEENAFVALNTAFMRDGAYINIPDGTVVDGPIHVIFISADHGELFMSHPRNLIIVGENCQVSLLESYVSLTSDTYFTNAVTEIVVGENSTVEHNKLQYENEQAFHVGAIQVHQARNSTFASNNISLGGALVRNNIATVLDGEGCESTLNGLYLATDKQHVDNHTAIDHAKPHCNSFEMYRGILGGKSHGVFNGKIFVHKDAQKTDAKQTNKNLILSDEASIDTKPQLEIFANDVKCTHGATVGQLDDEAIFYLQSRGVGLEEAKDILIWAFASDVIGKIKLEPLRERLHDMIRERLMSVSPSRRGERKATAKQ
jgi:Fe-S cluster assembly protein SufD